jgi:hypothetical protein
MCVNVQNLVQAQLYVACNNSLVSEHQRTQ